MSSLGPTLSLEPSPILVFFCSIWISLGMEKSLDGAQKKKTKLYPSFKFGAKLKFDICFAPSELLLAPREAWMKPKTKIDNKSNSKFGVGPNVNIFFCSIGVSFGAKKNSNGTKKEELNSNSAVIFETKLKLFFFLSLFL